MLRIEDGKIVEEWDSYDYLSILRELGATAEELGPAIEQYYELSDSLRATQ